MGLIDTHCHLDASEFEADRDLIMCSARENGIGRIVVPGVDLTSFQRIKNCCARYLECAPAYGIHPLYVDQAIEGDLDTLRRWLTTEPALAVGEIGLDFYIQGFNAERQMHFFVEQLKLAKEFNLPVILHVRRAIDPILKQLRRIKVSGGIAHAFNGSLQQAEAFINLGFKLGFGGAMTYSGSTRIRELARTLPLECIVLETDAPDIPPTWLQRERNTPGELRRIGEALAELRGISFEEVIRATTRSAQHALPGLTEIRLPSATRAFSAAP